MASEPVRGGVHRPGTAPAADTAALLYERYRDRVYGYCLYMLGNRDEAEDATQTTFLNAFRALRRGVVPAMEAAWLFKIAENVCLSARRSAARRSRVETPGDMAMLQEVTPAPERPADELIGLAEALADVSPAQRRAILLREWQGLSYREIGERLKLNQGAVETLLFRARRSLARSLTVPRPTRRRVARVLDFGVLAGAIKSAFAGASAVKVGATIAAVATATAVVGANALGDREPVEKEPAKQIDVASPSDGVTLGGSSLQRGERVAVARARAAPAAPAEVKSSKRGETGRAKARKEGTRASEPTASSNGASGGGTPPSPSASPLDIVPPAPPTPPALLPASPPSVATPALPPAPQLPVQPPSLPIAPPALPPVTLPALPPAPLP